MKTIKFILQKIITIEVMLIILFLVCNFFNISIPIINLIINTSLKYLTPIAIISLIIYIILSLLNIKTIKTAIYLTLIAIILYYLSTN